MAFLYDDVALEAGVLEADRVLRADGVAWARHVRVYAGVPNLRAAAAAMRLRRRAVEVLPVGDGFEVMAGEGKAFAAGEASEVLHAGNIWPDAVVGGRTVTRIEMQGHPTVGLDVETLETTAAPEPHGAGRPFVGTRDLKVMVLHGDERATVIICVPNY